MTDLPPQNSFEHIQSLCRDFRRQLKHGAPQRLEEYVNRADEDSRDMLFQNLLHIDIEFQRRQGLQPSSDDYIARFPQRARLIRQAFFESTLMSADPGAETPAEQPTVLHHAPAARKLGNYELLRQIGQGAFGAVYEAQHLQHGDIVALKLLPSAIDGHANTSGDADRLHRFRREFRALANVNHPHLVGMQALEVDGNQWFFTMDLVRGTDFLDHVRPGNVLNLQSLRSAAGQLVAGIVALHQRQIIHRDLKPSNVMVDESGHVVVLDFGLVIEKQPLADFTVMMTRQGFAGTPRYAAPEQIYGECDEASDFYSVGVMLYEALTGNVPFLGSTAELMRAKQSNPAPHLTGRADVPNDMAELVDRLLLRDPEERPGGEELLRSLHSDASTDSKDSQDSESTFSGRRSASSLIGRTAQLQVLQDTHSSLLEQRDSRVAFIRGRSGEGKTSLAETFLSTVSFDEQTLVLSGRCYDRESVPFKVIDSLIDPLVLYLRSKPDADVRSWLPEDVAMLAELFPVLRRVPLIARQMPAQAATTDRRVVHNRAFAAFRDLLSSMSMTTPVILFVDDLQWGDADSAAALRKMLQPPHAPAVLLLGTYRSDEEAESSFLAEWSRLQQANGREIKQSLVDVAPLNESECLSLVARRLQVDADSLCDKAALLFSAAQGNPWFLEQLIEGFDHETGTFHELPLREIVDRKLSRLPKEAGPFLDAMAVAGQAAQLEEIADVTAQPGQSFGLVTHMRNEKLVRLIGSGQKQLVDTYHDKIRETVLAGLSETQQRKTHAQFAELLIRQERLAPEDVPGLLLNEELLTGRSGQASSRVFDIAHHLNQAGDARAFIYHLLAGAVSLAAYGMETALEHLETARRLQPENLEQPLQYRLAAMLGKTLASCGRPNEAIKQYQLGVDVASTNAERAECLFARGFILWQRSEYRDAYQLVGEGLAELNERLPRTTIGSLLATARAFTEFHLLPTFLAPRLRRMSQHELATLCRFFALGNAILTQMDVTKMVYLTLRSCVTSRHLRDPAMKAEAFAAYSGCLGLAGVPWLPSQMLRAADAMETQLPPPQRTGIIDYYRGMHLYTTGHLREAVPAFELGVERLTRDGDYRENFAHHFAWHAWSHLGPTSPLLKHALAESRIGLQTGDEIILAYGRYGLAEAMAKRGDAATGLKLVHAAVDALKPLNPTFLCVGFVQLARVQIQAGDYEAARQSAWQAIRDIPRFRVFEISLPAFALYAEAVLTERWMAPTQSVSVRDRWKAWCATWAARASGWMFASCRPSAWRVSGRVAAAAGKTRRALRYFDRALKEAHRLEMHYELGRSLLDKSMLNDPDSDKDQRRGLTLLQEIECVPPVAEQKYLGGEQNTPPGVDLEKEREQLRCVLPDAAV